MSYLVWKSNSQNVETQIINNFLFIHKQSLMNAQTIQQNDQSNESMQNSEIMDSSVKIDEKVSGPFLETRNNFEEINEHIDEIQNSEIMTNNVKIDEKVLGREKTTRKIPEENSEIPIDDLNFEEINPKTFIKEPIDELKHIYNLKFKLFSNKDINIIHNEQWNTFNASKLAELLGKTPKQLNKWLSGDGINKYIDYITKVIYKQRLNKHLISSTETIESFKQHYIIYRIETNPHILKGAWLHYHLLPEVLRYCSNKYRFIANNFENVLLPTLTNINSSFEDFNAKFTSLYVEHEQQEISLISHPVFKGQAMEKTVLQKMKSVFGNSNVRPTKHNHCCDISILDGQILVEVKAVKHDMKSNDAKFTRDIVENQSTCNIGVYINTIDDDAPAGIRINPLRFYINKHYFNVEMFEFIKFTNEHIEELIVDKTISNRQLQSLYRIQTIDEALIKDFRAYTSQLIRAEIARRQLDSDIELNKYASATDAYQHGKVERDILRTENIDKFKELTKAFITLNYTKFLQGYSTKQAKIDLDEYLIANGLPKMGIDNIQRALNMFLTWDKSSITENKRKYVFIKGMENEFRPSTPIYEDDESNSNLSSDSAPTPEQLFEEFNHIPKIIKKLSRPGGAQSEQLRSDFISLLVISVCDKYQVSESRYTMNFQQLALTKYVQVLRNGHRWFIYKDCEEAKKLLTDFDEFVSDTLKEDKSIKFDKFEKLYKTHRGNLESLTRLITTPRFKDFKERLINK